MSNRIIANSGMMIASGLAMVLENIAENRRREHLRQQQEIWEEALVREKKFLAACEEMQSYEQMQALFKPLKWECARLLHTQTRLTEIAGFFACLGIDPQDIINPDGTSVSVLVDRIIEEITRNKQNEKISRQVELAKKSNSTNKNQIPQKRKIDRDTAVTLISECRSTSFHRPSAVSTSRAMKLDRLISSLEKPAERSQLKEACFLHNPAVPFSEINSAKRAIKSIAFFA